MKCLDMFAELKPKRAKPRIMMHVIDAGTSNSSECVCCMAKLQCKKCGHESEWLDFSTYTEAKKGIACPTCNQSKD